MSNGKEPQALESELTYLAEFILERTKGPSLGQHVGAHVADVAEWHDVHSGNCRMGHMYDDFPCTEYELAMTLGLAWMKDYILTLEKQLPAQGD